MLLRLAYPGMTNALSLLRLPPMSDRDKDTEILALRHQIMVLERQLGDARDFYNKHRPHQGIANARPLQPLPQPATHQEQPPPDSTSADNNDWAGSSTNTITPPDLHG
jgi:putative transposase